MLYVLGSLPCQSVTRKREITVVVDFNSIDAPESIMLLENGKIIEELPFDHTVVEGPLLKVLAQKYVLRTIYGGECVKKSSDFEPVLYLAG